ncbi:DUF86 domain-containing protein [Calidifontibacillus oryziterrae]|uniref:DUF86 domain-containing protein n=1 Tax=Calidifontibacillus oryziterrae TaxID=1191699 RepID=UPI0002E475C4|nr:DUF86 domain-containing protein [Calidifontibacillus oryziterrae]
MYFVDRQRIEEMLTLIEEDTAIFKGQLNWGTNIEKLALERIVYIIIESILDVGNAMIDGFIMRDPGSYEDIIDILLDEKVISSEDEGPLKAIISYRKSLVQNYLYIDHTAIIDGMTMQLPILERFPKKVRQYLDNELGPISAFIPS